MSSSSSKLKLSSDKNKNNRIYGYISNSKREISNETIERMKEG